MNVIRAESGNLASILMGKNIQFPWRGQKDVLILVPYTEWIKFITDYGEYLQHRRPLDYSKATGVNTGVSIRYFLYDISWALYSELACSSNLGTDATLILPHFDDGVSVSLSDVDADIFSQPAESIASYHNKLRAITRNYYNLIGVSDVSFGLVDLSNLSEWNAFVFKLCLYLQSKSSNTVTTSKLNIEWRTL